MTIMDSAKITIQVHLHTILQMEGPDGIRKYVDVKLPLGSHLQDLLNELKIELASDQILLVLNGRMAEPGTVLHDGDQVNLMPAISGGC